MHRRMNNIIVIIRATGVVIPLLLVLLVLRLERSGLIMAK